ncbi:MULTISPECIES: glycohydrolase toxin TNT-related protein [unclassified Sphingomonas]|uniref:glycohydrolase toxin TNT-related protein n=1 Tax=unclassified Sphingomonas TaxID=196159 RepID=UPI0006FCE15A|nr:MULTISPECIES: glycohydrolase toxin TNT-related protein [unclassified Sphingomonas]KQM63573.1 hypothetical protein ASE65_17135 [Sphingomonas sp. Leaf16]KQN15189.1 hypothetical protein ASE81_17150 [Sphingomonas sp. Leaf29]KQN20723.1 hypothetical protein ASE83_17115 [Sphingomonas sp. Leaf32]
MTMMPAARVGDDIAHSNAGTGMLLGVLAGAAVGAVLVAATVATGGLALVAAAGAAAGMVSAGGLGGMYIGEASMGPACGKFTAGSPDVFINGKAALFTAGSFASCDKDSGAIPLATGSSTVFINTGLAGREGEKVGCSAVSVPTTSPNVFIGGDSAQDPRVEIHPEVPQWAVTGLQILGIAGAIAALPYAVVAVGVAGIGVTAGAGILGSMIGASGGRALGEALGLSEAGTRALEVGGGFLGGMGGGAGGAKAIAGRRGWQWGTPPATRAALNKMPLPYQAQYATAKSNNWKWPNKGWPPNNGAAGPERLTTLSAKTKLDRYGGEGGGYMSPSGESFPSRAMRGDPPTDPPNLYTVRKDMPVAEADIAPWFDQPGGGKQYRLVHPDGSGNQFSVLDAIGTKYLRRGH